MNLKGKTRYVGDAVRLLKEAGATVEIDEGKHLKVRVAFDGKGGFTWTTSKVPSDIRSQKNAFAVLKKCLRDIGIEPLDFRARAGNKALAELWDLFDKVEGSSE